MPEDSPERQMDLLRMLDREDYPGEVFLSEEALDYFTETFEKYTVMDCGHWTQQEKPEETNRVLIDWLRRKIAKTA